ncbi:hypothetical protein TeGR_g14947, partial [Tetraparma gracilis]
MHSIQSSISSFSPRLDRNRKKETLTKPVNSVQGQPFDIADCSDCTLVILDYSDMVQIDNTHGSKVFVAASSESIFVRDCSNCTFTIACKQLRTRDCKNCTFYLYSKTEPIIETSSEMKFAPFNGAFNGHHQAMLSANLIPEHNLWFAVYDFNDEARTGKNWRLLSKSEEDPLWCPAGKAKSCCPRVAPGSIALPSEGADPTAGGGVTQSGGMMSFGLGTSLADAAKVSGDMYTAQEATAAAEADTKKKSPKKKSPTKSKIGWNPDAAAAPSPAKETAKPKSKIGWNPDAASPTPSPAKAAPSKSKI